MTSFNQRECVGCRQPCDGFYCYLCTYQQCGIDLINGICLNCTYGDGKPITCCGCEGLLNGGFCSFYASRAGNSFVYDPNPYSFIDTSNVFTHPPQPQYETYLCELCGNDSHYGYDFPPWFPLESAISLSDILSQLPPSIVITTSPPVLPIEDPDIPLIMGNKELNTIPEKESDKFIKSSVKDLVPIPSESEDTSGSDSMESIFEKTSQMDVSTPTSVAPLPISAPNMTPSTIATITTSGQAPILPTTIPSTIIQNLPNFGSLFRFNDRLRTLETNFSKAMQTNQFDGAASATPRIIQQYMDQRINKAVKDVNEQLEAEVLTRSSHSSKTSYAVAADLSKMELKKILIEKMKGNKDDDADKDEEPSARTDWGSERCRERKEPKSASAPTKTATRSTDRSTQGPKSQQASASESALAEEPMQTTSQMEEPSHSEFDTGPTYELMKGSCKSLIELEYHLEEVFKAIIDQLDWVNPEGRQYPHNLLKPLPSIPNNRGRRVIPFEHFINNNLEYLRGGASSRKYTTTITKTKAANYRHIMWIEDLVPRKMWIEEPIGYDKHAFWGVSHWGRKRQQFYGFAVNQESARDVYSKRRITAVTELKIVEWHSYKHLDWITVRRDDDKLYKFKEGDFKRLRIQDIEDMLLLLIQGKLTNLTVEEYFTFTVSLRMFTRSILIKRRVEDLQLGVESYQKKLNPTKPDSYRSDLKCKEAYTAYSNLRGFIYQNKDKRNRLMRIDELHKFSDGTLTDVSTALDDRLKRIQMQYLPQSIWRKNNKDRAAAMIQAIDKRLKTRRIMRILERFVGGSLYEGDFKMLQRTI
nr:hypothetical protein [Tanacetum cinerariifolium]